MSKIHSVFLGAVYALAAMGCIGTAAPDGTSPEASDDAATTSTADAARVESDAPASLSIPPVVIAADAGVVTADAGPLCATGAVSLNAFATRDGGFRTTVTSAVHQGVGACQTWQAGGDRWMRFTAPVAGLWRVSARGQNLWSFSAHRACEGASTEVACRQFRDYHAANPFSQPLAFDLELAAGETSFMLASGCLGGSCSWSVEVAPPVTVAGRCRMNLVPGDCREGWFCAEGTSLPSGVGQCLEATPPVLSEARAFAWEGALRLRVTGRDASRDVSSAEVELLDAEGVLFVTTIANLGLTSEGDSFVGRATVYLGARVLAVPISAMRVTLTDHRGLRSQTLRAVVSPPTLSNPGAPCDAAGVDNVCPIAYRCQTSARCGSTCVAGN